MASATQSLMTTAASTEGVEQRARIQMAIYTFNGYSGPNAIHPYSARLPALGNLTTAQAAAANINVLEVCQNNDLAHQQHQQQRHRYRFRNRYVVHQRHNAAIREPVHAELVRRRRCCSSFPTASTTKSHRHARKRLSGSNRCQQPFNTAWCTTVKNRGIHDRGAVYRVSAAASVGHRITAGTTAVSRRTRSQISPNLQSCASTGPVLHGDHRRRHYGGHAGAVRAGHLDGAPDEVKARRRRGPRAPAASPPRVRRPRIL